MPNWLEDAVFYEIYPQSFYDTNEDGIGDFQGIIEKLDYVKSLGCNALWINPCYDSPFMDAGYDVRNYKKTASRYGTNEDLCRLFGEAHNRGIKVLLDLVPGHTSDQHEWFRKSQEAEENEYSGRYIWTDGAFHGIKDHLYISGMSDRDGCYMLNFFASQPALNYGWLHPTEPWQKGINDPDAIATREAMKDIMRFWLDKGCDGFRVDMADSLVKEDDENKSATAAIWREIREMLDRDYPYAAMVSEWCNPKQALTGGGFHMDFYLNHWGNGYHTLLRDYQTEGGDHSYFKKDAGGDITRFLKDYLPKYEETKNDGYISFMTCNHDTPRNTVTLSQDELKLAYAVIFTLPGVPFLYYGDEIGMRYIKMNSKEGGYERTGTRTPMQWDHSKNLGFSKGAADMLYLPVDSNADAPTVEDQEKDPSSLLHIVRDVIGLRHREKDLWADGGFEVIQGDPEHQTFVYKRGNLILAVNPSGKTESVKLEGNLGEVLYRIGDGKASGSELTLNGPSFICVRLS